MSKIMKKSFLIVIIGMLSLGMSMNSCTSDDEDEADTRDQYVGTWNRVSEGSINIIEDGLIVETETINETDSVNISKSGENDLLIDGRIYFVNGFTLTSTPQIITNDDDDVTSSFTFTTTGVISSDSCTLVSDVTGTWTSAGRNGTYSGIVTETLTK
jgi:hypothetical protein